MADTETLPLYPVQKRITVFGVLRLNHLMITSDDHI